MTLARVHSIETFGTLDGPGIRYVIFLQGCPLRCKFCHNPDTWSTQGKKFKSVEDLVKDIKRYNLFLKKGGVTVSGGEPLLQIDFLIEFFKELKKLNIHTCIDTSGIAFKKKEINKYHELFKYCDLVLLDIKHIDNEKHIGLTRSSNSNVIKFAQFLNQKNIPVWIRHVLIPEITTSEEDLNKLKSFIDTLDNVEKVEVLPYHTMGVNKYEQLGIEYPLKDTLPPTQNQIKIAKKILNIK